MIRPGDRLLIEGLPTGALIRSAQPGESHRTAKAKRIAETRCVRCRLEIGVGRTFVEVSGALHLGGLYHLDCVKDLNPMAAKERNTQMQRLDRKYVAYLRRRAKKEKVTVVELTRRMLAAIQQKEAAL